jgi:hypothetical protein
MQKFLPRLVIALAVSFAAAQPADAQLTAVAKCNAYRSKVELQFSKCLNLANLLEIKGRSPERSECNSKYDQNITRARAKFSGPWWAGGLGVTAADCALEQAFTDAAKGLKLLATRQNVADFALETSDLYDSLQVRELIDAAIAAAPGPESNDELVCASGGGRWDDGACGPPLADYDCTVGALCSLLASSIPDILVMFTNDYVDDAPGLGNAASCTTEAWDEALAVLSPVDPLSELAGLYDYPSLVHEAGAYNVCRR